MRLFEVSSQLVNNSRVGFLIGFNCFFFYPSLFIWLGRTGRYYLERGIQRFGLCRVTILITLGVFSFFRPKGIIAIGSVTRVAAGFWRGSEIAGLFSGI